jgi:hypothetical protein
MSKLITALVESVFNSSFERLVELMSFRRLVGLFNVNLGRPLAAAPQKKKAQRARRQARPEAISDTAMVHELHLLKMFEFR